MFMIVRLESNNVSNISDLEGLNSFLNAINSTCNTIGPSSHSPTIPPICIHTKSDSNKITQTQTFLLLRL